MTSVRLLRVLRPSLRVGGQDVRRRAFHVGGASPTSRLLREERPGAPSGDQGKIAGRAEEGETEYKRHRLRTLEELEKSCELYTGPYPRLEPKRERRSISAFKKKYDSVSKHQDGEGPEPEIVYGRVMSIRRQSNKLFFVTIKNEVGTIQAMINHRVIQPYVTQDNFKLFSRMVERGDHISITGVPTRNNSGELIIEARELPELLSPAMEQIPQSLTDSETKSQKRHLDMLANPAVADTIRLRSYIMQYIRDHFVKDDFLEVQTPILAQNAGGAVARPFTTRATEFADKELSLRVAPELWLKRLVIGGLNKVFEMGPAFRNEGIDATHNPEFTTCEFYSAYTNLDDLIRITEGLLRGLAAHVNEVIAAKGLAITPVDATRFAVMERLEFVPALEKALGFSLPNLTGPDVLPELIAVLRLHGVAIPGDRFPASLPKLLDRLAAVHLEPRSFDRPVFITHHPACMSPLAKSFVCPTTRQLVSARAELFVDGRELANMYEEENDPSAQAQKLAAYRAMSMQGRRAAGVDEAAEGEEPREAVEEAAVEEEEDDAFEDEDGDGAPLDRSYIKAMEAGLPPTGGWGCGVERLVMLFSGAGRISDCLSFGTLNNVVGLTAGRPKGAPKTQQPDKEEGA